MGGEVKPDAGAPKSGGFVIKLLIFLGIIVLSAGAGVLTYQLVLADLINPPEKEAVVTPAADAIPATATPVPFDQQVVTLIREPGQPAAFLMYKITLECNNPETAAIVGGATYRARFIDLINQQHLSKTRTELDDAFAAQESLKRVILQKCNDLLRRIQGPKVDESIRVTAVFYEAFTIQDQ